MLFSTGSPKIAYDLTTSNHYRSQTATPEAGWPVVGAPYWPGAPSIFDEKLVTKGEAP